MTKKLLFLILFLSVPLYAEESIILSAPFDPDPRITSNLRLNGLLLYWGNTPSESIIDIQLSSGTIVQRFSYTGQSARDQMILLNKANLTSNSLEKRVFNKLISDGFLSGSVVGSPD